MVKSYFLQELILKEVVDVQAAGQSLRYFLCRTDVNLAVYRIVSPCSCFKLLKDYGSSLGSEGLRKSRECMCLLGDLIVPSQSDLTEIR